MPGYEALDPKTGRRWSWDGKQWNPITPPGATQRATTSFLGMPEQTNLNPLSSGFYSGVGDPSSYLNAIKQAATSLNPFPSMREAEATAENRFKQPGAMNKITGAEEFLESGFPFLGPGAVRSHEQLGSGDIAGGVGSAASAGLMAAGFGKTLPALAEHLTPMAINEMARNRVAGLLDVGENFEERTRKEHQDAIDTLTRKYEERSQEAGAKASEQEADYRTKLEQARDKYASKIAENERKKLEASVKETGAETKKNVLTQPRSGPVYQRLAGMADQVATKDVPQLDKDVRVAQNNRWNAFRQAIGDDPKNPKMVDWTPVQTAIADAEQNILQGSPENIATFRNMLREGVNPALENATIFQGATTSALEDILRSKDIAETAKPRLIEQLGLESEFKQRAGSGPAPAGAVTIPFEDARGYYTELGQKLTNANLPGDVRRALKSVQDAVDTKAIKPAIPQNQIGTYEQLKGDWAQYMSDFYDRRGPLAQLKRAATSDGRLNLITGGNGGNIVEALGRYSRFNPNVTGMAGRLRSLMRQIRDLPSSSPQIPGRLRPPRLPQPPEPVNLSERPAEVQPLDIRQAKLHELERMPKTWGSLRPWQAVIPYYWPRLFATKAIAEVLSHPLIREWIAGGK